jgi:hypothetical protein
VSVDISEENIPLKIKKAFVIFVPRYTATRWNLAVELLLLLLYSFFPNLLNCLKQNICLLFYVGAYSDLR